MLHTIGTYAFITMGSPAIDVELLPTARFVSLTRAMRLFFVGLIWCPSCMDVWCVATVSNVQRRASETLIFAPFTKHGKSTMGACRFSVGPNVTVLGSTLNSPSPSICSRAGQSMSVCCPSGNCIALCLLMTWMGASTCLPVRC